MPVLSDSAVDEIDYTARNYIPIASPCLFAFLKTVVLKIYLHENTVHFNGWNIVCGLRATASKYRNVQESSHPLADQPTPSFLELSENYSWVPKGAVVWLIRLEQWHPTKMALRKLRMYLGMGETPLQCWFHAIKFKRNGEKLGANSDQNIACNALWFIPIKPASAVHFFIPCSIVVGG